MLADKGLAKTSIDDMCEKTQNAGSPWPVDYLPFACAQNEQSQPFKRCSATETATDLIGEPMNLRHLLRLH
eukprot:3904331-Amphidinium_carterae.1